MTLPAPEGDDDDFWKIALEEEPTSNREKNGAWGDDDDSNGDDTIDGSKPVAYRLPTTQVTLHLESLAASNGIWSPLGADAWYASALLASMVLTNKIPMLPSTKTVLELGSGAVGLSGLACAVAMARKENMDDHHRIILSDNDPPVLERLKLNAERNLDAILSSASTPDALLDIQVQHLDWNEECDESSPFRNSIDLVIGSELVYTQETAEACSKLLKQLLLNNNQRVDIWVVQVTDRYGWLDVVVPRLKSLQHVSVVSVPISSDTHELAASMIPTGGILDRYAYGAFHIQRQTSGLDS
ncbi:unnamed protein product [Cylindrotheca closterium]|uniref:Calmodulin-lysine N-methyltransferase n=1 Tax=Cylindrotheca closterium TaxID=2856 RepID=A0AAD2FIZ2_9STRA|nr:unnamed protein product [Cylindrotheca closterium]